MPELTLQATDCCKFPLPHSSHARPQVNEALSLLERQAELSRSTPALPMDDKSELATLRLGAAAASRCRAENAELVERVR